jgi:hypothetical protein
MRHIAARALSALLTFSFGLLLALLCGGLLNQSVRRPAPRAEDGLKAPHVAEAENNFRKRRILFDLRDYRETSDSGLYLSSSYSDYEAFLKEAHEARRRIMPKLFPGGYLDDYGQCSDESRGRRAVGDDDLAWARAHGQFVPYTGEWHRGSFTAPGARQVLYEIVMGACGARLGEIPRTRVYAVFDSWDGLYASFEVQPSEYVYAVRDVNGDDVDEVLLGHGEMRGYNYVSRMRLVSLNGGSLRVLHEFGIGYVYSLADSRGDDRIITVPVIYYTPRGDGETPEFQTDFYRAYCFKGGGCGFMPKPSEWAYFKSGGLSESDLPGFMPPWVLPDLNSYNPSSAHP